MIVSSIPESVVNRFKRLKIFAGQGARPPMTLSPTQQRAADRFIDAGWLRKSGWLDSAASGRPVAGDGTPLPWFCYPAIHLLTERLPKHCSVIEFGAGMSTLWWAERTERLLTLEHDADWCSDIKKRGTAAMDLRHVPLAKLAAEVDSIAATGELFDIGVIDNVDRATAAVKLSQLLKPTAVIVFDNSDELVYRPSVDYLKAQGFRELRLHALGPVNPFEWSTSFLYRDGNCLGL